MRRGGEEVKAARRRAWVPCAKMRAQSTYLNQVLALSLSDERLEFRGGEGVDESGL